MSKAGINVEKRDNDNPELSSTVARYRKQLEDLPEPGQDWMMQDVDSEWLSNRAERIRSAEIIRKVGEDDDNHANKPINIYRTTEMAWKWLEYYRNQAKRKRVLPCSDEDCPGCSFENPRDVDGIVCKDCNEVHNPDGI